jgi:hypothetical protein
MIEPITLLSISAVFFSSFLVKRNAEKSEALKALESAKLEEKLKFSGSIDYNNGIQVNDCE